MVYIFTYFIYHKCIIIRYVYISYIKYTHTRVCVLEFAVDLRQRSLHYLLLTTDCKQGKQIYSILFQGKLQ